MKFKRKSRENEAVVTETLKDTYDWIQCLISALIICVMLFVFVLRVVDVRGTSMNPTLQNGDKMLVSDLFYKPKQGDVVVFKKDEYDPDKALVKRVIAVGGQEVNIDFANGIVYVDGLSVGDTSKDVLDERTTLSNCGFACICAAVDHKRHQILGNVRVEMHGITGGDVAELRRVATDGVKCTLRRSVERGVKGKDLEKACRDSLHSLLWDRTKQRPMVIATIIEV